MAIGDLYKMQISYNLPDSEVSIGLGYRQNAGTNGINTLQSAVDFFVANRLVDLNNVIGNDCFTDQVRMDQVSVGDEQPGLSNSVGVVGNRPNKSLPAGMAAVITWITDAPNSKHNGRIYIAGITEGDIENAGLIAAIKTLLATLATNWRVDLPTSLPETAVFELVAISRVEDGVPRVPPIGFKVVSSLTRNAPYSQRRRITKRLGIS